MPSHHHRNRHADHVPPPAFLGSGPAAASIASYDWSRTPVGPIREWSSTLRTATAILIRSTVPMMMLWGEEGILFYNDAYARFAGERRPDLLGRKLRECDTELAEFHARAMQAGLAGRTLTYRDQELVLFRGGRHEQVFVDLDYWPLVDESGDACGVLGNPITSNASSSAFNVRGIPVKRGKTRSRCVALTGSTGGSYRARYRSKTPKVE